MTVTIKRTTQLFWGFFDFPNTVCIFLRGLIPTGSGGGGVGFDVGLGTTFKI